VDDVEDEPPAARHRGWERVTVDIVGPVVVATAIGSLLLTTSTPATGDEVAAYLLYVVTAVFVTGLIWDVLGVASNARARTGSASGRPTSSCLFGLLPVGAFIVGLSAMTDGSGWIFDWRLTALVIVAANVCSFVVVARSAGSERHRNGGPDGGSSSSR
jgi:hypothetical protein